MSGRVGDLLSKNGSYSHLFHNGFELVAAVFVAEKHVEARETGAEDHVVAGASLTDRAFDRFGQGQATGGGQTDVLTKVGEFSPGFADQEGMTNLAGDPAHEARQIAPFRLAAADPENRLDERGEGGFDGVKIRGL